MKCLTIIFLLIALNSYGQKFSKDSLIIYMNNVGIKYIPFSLAQSIHETGNFKSDLFINNHNLFGMRMPEKRKTLAIGIRRGYAVYKNWHDSVKDFHLMQIEINKRHSTYSSYIAYIFRNYAKDPLYKQKLQKYIK